MLMTDLSYSGTLHLDKCHRRQPFPQFHKILLLGKELVAAGDVLFQYLGLFDVELGQEGRRNMGA